MAKCSICKKKINSIMVKIYTCKCSKIFCSKHLHDHNCSYDYSKNEKERLSKILVLVNNQKIDKI